MKIRQLGDEFSMRTDGHDVFCERALKYSDIDKCFGLYRAKISWLVS